MTMVRKKDQVDSITHPLQRIRVMRGLRQKDVADAIDRPTSYIGKIENGILNINNVTLGNGYKISKVLGCRMEDLIDSDNLVD